MSSAAVPAGEGLPTYAELWARTDGPPGSAWGVFGAADRVGAVNLQTSARVVAAARLVVRGRVHSLNWSLAQPDPPLFHRRRLRREVDDFGSVHDDHYSDFYPQGSSQWDAIAHVDHPRYGGWNDLPPTDAATIDHLARRGMAGRFLIVDVARYRSAHVMSWDPGRDEQVEVDELDQILSAGGDSVQPGDIVLIRLGWVRWWLEASNEQRALVRRRVTFPGLSGSAATAEWLWDHHVSAVATDAPSIEVLPVRGADHLHPELLSLLGITVGELFDLESLSADCAENGVHSGLFTSAPLNLPGGFGSPANALAIV